MTRRPAPSRLSGRHRTLFSVLALLSVGLGIAWTTEAVTRVDRFSETLPSPTWREEAAFTYSVPVRDGTPGFPNGTVLGMDEPGHLVTISPQVRLAFTWRLAEPTPPPERASVLVEAVLASTSPQGQALWTLRETLAETTLASGSDALSAEAALDLPALEERVRREVLSTGQPLGNVAWRVDATVRFSAALPGEAGSDHEGLFTFPVAYTPPLYVLPGAEEIRWSRAHGEPRVVVHEDPVGLRGIADAPHAPVAALAGLGALALLWRDRDPLRPDYPPGARQATLDEVGP